MVKMISIIVPVHNSEKTLDRCVESIVKQTYKDIRIVLVENGSTDASFDKCSEWAQKDERIVVLRSEKGVSNARNKGLEYVQSTGSEYFGFVDSDDYVESEMYGELIAATTAENADIAVCKYYKVNGDEIKVSEEDLTELVAEKNIGIFFDRKRSVMGAVWKCLFDKRHLNVRFDPHIRIAEDLVYFMWTVKSAEKICFVDKALYYYSDPIYSPYYKHAAKSFVKENAEAIISNLEILFEGHNDIIEAEKFMQYVNIVKVALYGCDDSRAAAEEATADAFCRSIDMRRCYRAAVKRGLPWKERLTAFLAYRKMWAFLGAIVNRNRRFKGE